MQNDLKDKVCVITGGSGVLGSAISVGLAESGVKIAIIELDREKSEEFAKKLGSDYGIEAIGIHADVMDRNVLMAAKKKVNDKFGKTDILINTAGGNSPQATTKLTEIKPEDLDSLEDSFFGLEDTAISKVFSLNFMGTLLPISVFSKEMVEAGNGVILNVSSMSAFRALTKVPAYSAAKAAINSFTHWLAVHFGKTGVRVNAIAPGFFLTDQNRFLLTEKENGNLTERGKKIIDNTPMGRFGDPEDLQGTCEFLVSSASNFLTGVVIPVDGGYSAFGGV